MAEDNGNDQKYSERDLYSQDCHTTPPWQLVLDEFIFETQTGSLCVYSRTAAGALGFH
jgi:hypothetical protein